jgi:hypothetical protein
VGDSIATLMSLGHLSYLCLSRCNENFSRKIVQ